MTTISRFERRDPMKNRLEFLDIFLDAPDGVTRPAVIIGCDVRYCPDCYNPLSFVNERPFCRNCQEKTRLKKNKLFSRRSLWL